MDQKYDEICKKLHQIEESAIRQRKESLGPILGKSWSKTKLKKDRIIDLLTASDRILVSSIEEIAKLKKDLWSLFQPETPTDEEDKEEEKAIEDQGEEIQVKIPEREEGDDVEAEEEEEEEEEAHPNLAEVCPFYLKGKCRHGRLGTKMVRGSTCAKKHPQICRKFSNYGTTRRLGCTRGSDCKYFHRPLCKNSELKRECYNKDCKNHHLKHTRRFQAEEGWQIATGGHRKNPPNQKKQGQNQKKLNNGSGNNNNNNKPTGTKTGEDFCQRILDRLNQSIPQLIATEISRQMHPRQQSNPFTWQLPAGMTMTRSPV